MFGLSHSRGITVMLSFKTRLPFDVLPEWKEVRGLPQDAQIRALRDPDVRKKLVDAAHHGDYGRPIGAEARKPDYDVMRIFERPVPPTPTVAEVAAERGVDPVELMIDLAVETDFEQFFVQPLDPASDDDLLAVLKHPRTRHDLLRFGRPRQPDPRLLDPDPPARLLGARPPGLHPRGGRPDDHPGRRRRRGASRTVDCCREGLVADLNVLDPARVAPEMPTLEYDLPGGARRLVQKASGFLATVVGGEVVLRSGTPTGARPGQLLRGPLAGV